MNSVYGFKDDEYDDESEEVDETGQKDHKALNRLKRIVGKFKEETQNYIDLRSTLFSRAKTLWLLKYQNR